MSKAASFLAEDDYTHFGQEIGALALKILKYHKSKGCDSSACIVVEGLTHALDILDTDVKICEKHLKKFFEEMVVAFRILASHRAFDKAVQSLSWNETANYKYDEDHLGYVDHARNEWGQGEDDGLVAVSRRARLLRRLDLLVEGDEKVRAVRLQKHFFFLFMIHFLRLRC